MERREKEMIKFSFLGEIFICSSLVFSALQTLLGFTKGIKFQGLKFLSSLTTLFLIFSFLTLIFAFITSDFSLKVVFLHTHEKTPFLYKLSAAWGHHEGSFLLWISCLSSYGFFFAFKKSSLLETVKNKTLGFQGFLIFIFLLFLIFTSDPFNTFSEGPLNGLDLNPILQDVSLSIHPPILYLGYAGFSLIFSLCVSFLLNGNCDQKIFLQEIRFWGLLPLAFLTFGIMIGSYWAYYELGWGGYWFWDPVENASLMPWISGVAFIHAVLLAQRKNIFYGWPLFFGFLTFLLCVFGTFLVRSGLLMSVHNFAEDPDRGNFILMILTLLSAGSFILFLSRRHAFKNEILLQKEDVSFFLKIQRGLFLFFLSVIFLGTLYPLILETLTHKTLSVGAPYFNKVLLVPCIVALGLMIFVPFSTTLNAAKNNKALLTSFLGAAVLTVWLFPAQISYISVAMGFFVSSALVLKIGLFWLHNLKAFLKDFKFLGMGFAHMGIGLMMIGIFYNAAHQKEIFFPLKKGESQMFQGFTFNVQDFYLENYPTWRSLSALLKVQDSSSIFFLRPERRFYVYKNHETTETALYSLPRTAFLSDLYVTLGEEVSPQCFEFYIKYYPFIRLIWLGAGLVGLGLGLSCFERIRYKRKGIVTG